jgi:exosortase C (VPDSG-CTERM-specific)
MRARQLRARAYTIYLVLLTLSFLHPLANLVLYAAHSDLHSHILLVPLISAYVFYIRRPGHATAYRTSVPGTVVAAAIGFTAFATSMVWRTSLSVNDELALTTLAFVCLVTAGGFLFFGSKWMAVAAFPFAFLIFMVPLPDAAVRWLEQASVLGSTEVADLLIRSTGTPLARAGTELELPGIVLRVAQACSGIRSSWVLFITSVLAAHLFLKTRWRKLIFVAFVIPLGIVRNGFRILVIALLCVHFGPEMIDSPIHHHGGPLFFGLSLVPFFLLLRWLRRQERLNLRPLRTP